jgi:hypothetical protein
MYNTECTFPCSHKTVFRPGQKTKENFNILICEIRSIWTMSACADGVGAEMAKQRVLIRAVESESVKMYRLRLRPQSKTISRYSKSRTLIAAVTIRLILKYRL